MPSRRPTLAILASSQPLLPFGDRVLAHAHADPRSSADATATAPLVEWARTGATTATVEAALIGNPFVAGEKDPPKTAGKTPSSEHPP